MAGASAWCMFVKGAWHTGEKDALEQFGDPRSPGTSWAKALPGKPRIWSEILLPHVAAWDKVRETAGG